MTRYNSSPKKIREKDKNTSRVNRKLKVLNLFLLALIAVGGAYYVALVNDLTVKGLKAQELKNRVSTLREENRNLNVRVTSLKSYNAVAQRTDDLGMTSINDVKYLKAPEEVLAKK